MKRNKIKELWGQGKPAVMGWCASGNPYIAELMANAGYDALVIDWQHGEGTVALARQHADAIVIHQAQGT